jgi:hypothetical protein
VKTSLAQLAPVDALVFVADRDGLGSIFESAYLVPASMLQSSKLVTGVVVLSSIGTWLKPSLRKKWEKTLKEWRPKLGLVSAYPTLPKQIGSAGYDEHVLRHAFGNIRRRFGPTRLVASTGAARLLPILSRLRQSGLVDRAVYHVWGPDAEEHRFTAQCNGTASIDPSQIDQVHSQQKAAIAMADASISISSPMTHWLTSTMKARPESVFEIPWLADGSSFDDVTSHRTKIRRALDLNNSFVLGYCGSMLSWQLEPSAVSRIVHAARAAMPRVRFLGLTMHQQSLRKTLSESGLAESEIRLLNVPFSEVPKYLSAMDLGILGRNLFRPPELVNQLSSPVKFGEYLLSGVPVILSDALEDFAALTRDNQVGVVVSEDATIPSIARDLTELFRNIEANRADLGERCVRVGKAHVTYQSRMSTYANAHGIQVPQVSQ